MCFSDAVEKDGACYDSTPLISGGQKKLLMIRYLYRFLKCDLSMVLIERGELNTGEKGTPTEPEILLIHTA